MKSIIWKELRENLKWAALGFLCLLLADVFTLSFRRSMAGDRFNGITLCNDTFLLVSAFGCSAIGAILGALQILPELRRDQWASLLHRPISRHAILVGKVIAGLMLYGLATGLPLLASTVYVAMPGHFPAPFVPGLIAPPASDLLLGTVFYFTALLIGLHSGRWFGSRGAIALGAVAVMGIHLAGLWPFALPLGAAVMLFIAAWGAMQGAVSVRGGFSRFALGLIVLVGVATGLLLIGIPLRAGAQRVTLVDLRNFYITNDGTVLIHKQGGKDKSAFTDTDGKDVSDDRYDDNNSGRYSLFPYPLANLEFARARLFPTISRSSQDYVELVSGNQESPELWYRIAGSRSYFVGYDSLSARRIGICDADGFKNPGSPIHPFASELESEPLESAPQLLWVGSRAYAVDFTERRFALLLDAKGDEIYGALKFPYTSDHPRIAIALSSTIHVLEISGAPIYTIPYGHDPKILPNVSVTATEDFARTFFQYTSAYDSTADTPDALVHLDLFDARGHRTANYTIPATDYTAPAPTWGARIAGLLSMPVPVLLVSAVNHYNGLSVSVGGFGSPLVENLDSKEIYALFGLAVVLSVAACLWARMDGLPIRCAVLWVVLTLVFGLPGFLAYRISTHWPALVRCSRCAQRRPVDLVACPHCHGTWEPVAPSGAEIFEVS